MELEIVRADPAGNITVFVLNPPGGAQERLRAAKALLADPALGAEQAGFALPPESPGGAYSGKRWRLEMMGGEFCGNASRSFALLAAARSGLAGKHTVMIETSGMARPVPVYIDTDAQTAEIALPPPVETAAVWEQSLPGQTPRLPVYEFEGISHIIAENVPPAEQTVRRLIQRLTEDRACDALGVMFYDSRARFMRPAVWVRATDTLVFESSCGSGSAALGVWAARAIRDGEMTIELTQPGGVITASVTKQAGTVTRLSISGKVTLGKMFLYHL